MPLGLYVHIPFCSTKCYYCDFLSYQNQEKRIPDYIDALIGEIKLYRDRYGSTIPEIDTIYFGGGTPSSIQSEYISKLMESISEFFDLCSDAEITIEANPKSLDDHKLKEYLECGVNRISLGVQTFDDELLELMNRDHRSRHVYESVELIRSHGIENINFDLIFAMPLQSMHSFEGDIRQTLKLKPMHVSLYSLIVEPNTHLNKMIQEGLIELPDEDLDRLMYHYGTNILREAEYEHYEISNFALPGYRSAHNLKYWRNDRYIGIGLGSSSHFDGMRYCNQRSFKRYAEMISKGELPIAEIETVDERVRELDYILMNLRLSEGISLEEFNIEFKADFLYKYKSELSEFLEAGKMKLKDGRIAFTEHGFDISNSFFVKLM